MSEWVIDRVRADVATLHALGSPEPALRLLRWCEPTDIALVLGRAQSESDVVVIGDASLVRRSSGGGAVLVVPDEIIWFDVVIPKDDPLWTPDVTHAFFWLGDVIAQALRAVGIDEPIVHKGGLIQPPELKAICFAGLGPGEVVVGQRKAVGLSQRRTRDAALFQCSLFLEHRAEQLATMLGLPAAEQALDETVVAFPWLNRSAFEAALIAELDA